jgi:DNA-binding response OmpR family regulator
MARILIVEDAIHIVTPVEKGLRSHGFITAVAKDGHEAISIARDADFDLVLLDIGLPTVDGLVVLSELRARGEQMPIIMLTARDDVQDKIAGLEGGATDYVTKPFNFQELLARIRLRIKEADRSHDRAAQILIVGNISLNLQTHQACINDRLIQLPAREFMLLATLMKSPGSAVGRDRLLKEIWG